MAGKKDKRGGAPWEGQDLDTQWTLLGLEMLGGTYSHCFKQCSKKHPVRCLETLSELLEACFKSLPKHSHRAAVRGLYKIIRRSLTPETVPAPGEEE